jgi:hypothetical protein
MNWILSFHTSHCNFIEFDYNKDSISMGCAPSWKRVYPVSYLHKGAHSMAGMIVNVF